MSRFFALKVKATRELMLTLAEDGYECLSSMDYVMRLIDREIWIAFLDTEIIGFCDAYTPYIHEMADSIKEHAKLGVIETDEEMEILIDRICFISDNLIDTLGFWIESFEIRRDWRGHGYGRTFYESVFSGKDVLVPASADTEGFWEAVGLQSETNHFFSTPKKLKGKWNCPNGCDSEYFLVCGGDDIRIFDPQEALPNLYFRIKPDGRSTGLLDDGSPVPVFCIEHAEGGCINEPVCPECRTAAVLEVTKDNE